MHLILLLLLIPVSIGVRWAWQSSRRAWRDRWKAALSAFLIPPILLIAMAIAILYMGVSGQMFGISVGWPGYVLAWTVIGITLTSLAYRGWLGWRSLHQVRQWPQFMWAGGTGRILDSPRLFAAQIGFWRPELVVSQGLLSELTPEQVRAVLIHEQAHTHYRDTFWFFWLGWLCWLTAWLPKTRALWQELLFLREIRADYRATREADALLLAETLLQVVRSPIDFSSNFPTATLTEPEVGDRLTERIDFLLAPPPPQDLAFTVPRALLIAGLAPLLTLILHH
jgi:Zn-dependent protease with chaperone function